MSRPLSSLEFALVPTRRSSVPEAERLAVLERYRILDTPDDPAFDRLAHLAAQLLRMPAAMVTIVAEDRQWAKAGAGAWRREVPRADSFCTHTIEGDGPLVVEDATADERFRDNPFVTGPTGVRAYAGVPLRVSGGARLGALCVLDTQPRAFPPAAVALLTLLAEQAVDLLERHREGLLQADLFELHPQPALLYDTHTLGIVAANARAAELYGYDREALLALSVADLRPPEDVPALLRYLAQRDGEAGVPRVWRHRRADGSVFFAEVHGRDVAHGGRPARLVFVHDVTERLHWERTAREHEAHLRLFVEAVKDHGIALLDVGGRVVRWNEGAARLTGFTAAEAHGRHFSTFDAEAAREPGYYSGLLGRAAEHGRVAVEACRRRADGSTFWAEVVLSPLHDAEGRVVGYAEVVRDVSERRAADEALRASETHARRLAEVANRTESAVAITDTNGRIGWVNEAFERHTGYGFAEAEGHRVLDLLAGPETDPETLAALHERLRLGQPATAEAALHAHNGDAYWVALELQPTFDADGWPVGYVAIAKDISARKHREAELVASREQALAAKEQALAAQAQAEELARLKTAFLSNMSHEIRTPLTAILGFAELLADEVPPDARPLTDRIQTSGQRLLETINSVLDLAQLEGRGRTLARERLDVAAEAEQVRLLLADRARSAGLALTVEADGPVAIVGDRAALHRALTNVVSNALKFTPEGGVAVRVAARDGRAVVEVADTGVGIAPAFLPHVFDEFRQESTGYERSFEGSGLGLAITRQLVELHGGTIAAESALGAGSTFTLAFPLADAADPQPEAATDAQAALPAHAGDGAAVAAEALVMSDGAMAASGAAPEPR